MLGSNRGMYRLPLRAANDPADDKPGRSLFGLPGEGTPHLARPSLHRAESGPAPRVPRIETDRLILRGYRSEDAADYAALMEAPETFRFSERGPMTAAESWTRLLRHVGHWSLNGWGLFALEEKASGRLVGEAGLEDFRRGLGDDFERVPEASWTIASWAWGLGYATEAAAAALAWMEDRFGTDRTVCVIHAGNAASLRVAEKLGYDPFATSHYRGYPAILLERGWEAL